MLSDLLTKRCFLPLFLTQTVMELNAKFYKFAAMMVLLFGAAAAEDGAFLVTLVAALTIAPVVLVSGIAGWAVDRWDKAAMLRWSQLLHLAVAAIGAWSLFVGIPQAIVASALMFGVSSAIFGPLKYAILPDHVPVQRLLAGNSLIAASGFTAILVGTIFGSLIGVSQAGRTAAASILILFAVLGVLFSRRIPPAPPRTSGREPWRNPLALLLTAVAELHHSKTVMALSAAISWFWLVGATYLALLPIYVRDVLQADKDVVSLFVTMFLFGLAGGALTCNLILRREVRATSVPWGAAGMAVFGLIAVTIPVALDGGENGVGSFMANQWGVLLLLSLLGIAFCGGIYIVPLYALLQTASAAEKRGRTIGANNTLNAFVTGIGMGLLAVAASRGVPVTVSLMAMSILGIGVAGLTVRLTHRHGIARIK